MLRFLSIFFVILLPFEVQAIDNANLSFSHLTNRDGMPSNYVRTTLLDRQGFLWFGTSNGLVKYDGNRLQQYDCYDRRIMFGNNDIVSLFEHPSGQILVGTSKGLFAFTPADGQFCCLTRTRDYVRQLTGTSTGHVWFPVPRDQICHLQLESDGSWSKRDYSIQNDLGQHVGYSVFVDDRDRVWIGTEGQGIYTYNEHLDRMEPVRSQRGEVIRPGSNVADMCQLASGQIVIATEDGILDLFHPTTHECRQLARLSDPTLYIYDICSLNDDVWVGNVNGLHIVNATTGQEVKVQPDAATSTSLSDKDVVSIYRDRYDGMWVGTKFGGVNGYSKRRHPFTSYVSHSASGSIHSNRIRGLAEDSQGRLWIGSEDPGISLLDLQTGQFIHPEYQLTTDNVNDIACHKGTIYLGLFHHGLDVLQPHSTQVQHIQPDDDPNNHSIYATLIDSFGREWVAMDRCVKYRSHSGGEWHRLQETGTVWIFGLYEARNGDIWICTMGDGIWRFTADLTQSYHYTADTPGCDLRSDNYSAIMQDSQGRIWASSDRGHLALYQPDADSFVTFGAEYGIPENTYNLLEDMHGHLWFGTNRGLVCFDPSTKIPQLFTTREGLPDNQFNYHSACQTHDGTFWMGTVGGLISFRPEISEDMGDTMHIYFDAYDALNSPLYPGTEQLSIAYDSATFSIHVAVPTFSSAIQPELQYRLSPVKDAWQVMPENQTLSFANLAPGHYTLYVEATRGSQQAQASYSFTITPPWYITWWANLLYMLLALLAATGVFLYYRRLTKKRLAEHKKLYALHMEKQLNENKVQFFTEIAHEIRTPLTLIDSPLEAIQEIMDQKLFLLSSNKLDTQAVLENSRIIKGHVETMRRNTRRLLDLTNQLLDFQKIGQRRFTLHYEAVEVHSLIEQILERFKPTFELKHKTLTYQLGDDDIIAVVDREALTKIVSNLVNNALKYSQRKTHVTLTVDDQQFRLSVLSDGELIAQADKERIFKPFYQVDSDVKRAGGGVGIGLPLSRQLALQHKGNLYLKVEEENQFVLEIPLNRESLQQQTTEKLQKDRLVLSELNEDPSSQSEVGYSLLLVEDNEEMLQFMADQLSQYFTITKASNGKEALEALQKYDVDLILTDVMMPVMDGFELCQELKKDENRANIPVVFLTAKNDTESKIKGLQYGAEAYIEKPFSMKYLRQQLQSILDNRRRERISFQKKPFFNVDNMKVSKQDEEFMQKLVCHIESNMSKEDFTTEQLADDMCMSRSTLLRRIKALYGVSPIELIRTIRLKKAAQLIQQGDYYKISEIGYLVGISSNSYFTKLFFKQFGITPRDFAAQYHPVKAID